MNVDWLVLNGVKLGGDFKTHHSLAASRTTSFSISHKSTSFQLMLYYDSYTKNANAKMRVTSYKNSLRNSKGKYYK